MNVSPPRPSAIHVPAIVLALALLAGFAATGARVVGWVGTAPSTALPAQALADMRHRLPGETQASDRPEVGPTWGELTTAQKQALYPLANRWSLLTEAQKRHWLKLSVGFHALEPGEQEKMLSRLTDWASLSAQQRSQARLNYAVTGTLAGESKRAKWEAYQALSEEERKRLAAKVAPQPAGAAPAVRPSPKKLVHVPAASNVPPTTVNPPKIPRSSVQPAPQIPPAPAPPAPPPVVVETRPVDTPSALGTALPALSAQEPPAPEPAISGNMEPLHPPQ